MWFHLIFDFLLLLFPLFVADSKRLRTPSPSTSRDVSFKKFFYLASPDSEPGDGRRVFSYALRGAAAGQALEVCFAQYWSSLGDSSVEVRAAFRTGVTPSERTVTLVPGQGWSKVSLYNPGPRTVTVKPEGKLSNWTRVLLPSAPGVVAAPTVPSRDVWPDGRLTHTISVEYGPFDQASAGKVTPSCPLLAGLLYDSPVGAQMFTFKDRHGRVVGTVDAFPEHAQLGAGSGFTCTLTVAHHDVSVLKKFERAPLWLQRSCKSDVKVAVHASRASVAMGGGGAFKARVLRPGQRCNVFVALDARAKLTGAGGSGGDVRAGDFFTGTISYVDEKSDSKVTSWGAGKMPGGFPLKAVFGGVEGGTSKGSAKKKKDSASSFGVPGTLKSRGAAALKWAIHRLTSEFEGKADEAYADEAAAVREAIEAAGGDSAAALLGGLTPEEVRCLEIMLLHSELRHADREARKGFYLGQADAAEVGGVGGDGTVVGEADVVVDVDGEAKAAEGQSAATMAASDKAGTVAAADKLIAAIDAEAIVSFVYPPPPF